MIGELTEALPEGAELVALVFAAVVVGLGDIVGLKGLGGGGRFGWG